MKWHHYLRRNNQIKMFKFVLYYYCIVSSGRWCHTQSFESEWRQMTSDDVDDYDCFHSNIGRIRNPSSKILFHSFRSYSVIFAYCSRMASFLEMKGEATVTCPLNIPHNVVLSPVICPSNTWTSFNVCVIVCVIVLLFWALWQLSLYFNSQHCTITTRGLCVHVHITPEMLLNPPPERNLSVCLVVHKVGSIVT